MEELYIQSRYNDQIKNLVRLRERKHRNRQESFLVEGLRELSYAVKSDYSLTALYYCPEHFPTEQHAQLIHDIRSRQETQLVRVSKEVFAKATYRESPDGILAIARQGSHTMQKLRLSPSPILLILEGIEKPGNLGAILRSADGAGADAVILVDCMLDLYNPNVIRASQGLIFAVSIAHAERNFLVKWLAEQQVQCIATTPGATQSHWEPNYKLPTALLFGSESHGLSHFWLNHVNQQIRIPMSGKADSLNVSVATAICLYETKRQRTQTSE